MLIESIENKCRNKMLQLKKQIMKCTASGI